MPPERVVEFRPRTIAMAAGVLLGIGLALWVVWLAHRVVVWVFISLFLALAMEPAVRFFERHGVRRRGLAAGIVYLLALALVVALGALFIPTLVSQVNDFANAVPGYVRDLTHGRGPLGFLETKYHVVERVQKAIDQRGGGSSAIVPKSAAAAVAVGQTIVSFVAAAVTIAFMTFFMLMEGPAWLERFYALVSDDTAARWRRINHDIGRTVSGYVTGNLLISVIAGTAAAIVLAVVNVPFAIALGLVVAVLDLIPLAGATLGAIVCVLVALTVSTTTALIVVAFFVVYQQLENHLLQPLVYGRTVELSPLAVLIAVLIGADLGGVVGALSAIPVAGTIQILLREWLSSRQARRRRQGAHDSQTAGGVAEPRITRP